MCFAYKLTTPIVRIGYQVLIDGQTTKNAYVSIETIADNSWHYTCVDLYQALLSNWQTSAATYPTYRLTLIGVNNFKPFLLLF